MLEGDLITEIQELGNQMEECLGEYETRGETLAKAEMAYQIAKRKLALKEKASHTPVTFISEFCKGDEEVALLRMERDIASAKFKVMQDKIYGIRLKMRICESQAEREWSDRKTDNSIPPEWVE